MLNPKGIIRQLGFERLAGTTGEKKAVEVITAHLDNLQLPYQTEVFSLTTFQPGEAVIEINNRKFPARPYGLNRNTRLSGEFVYLDNPEILELNRGAYQGKIVMSCGFSRRLAPILKEAGVAAYINIGGPGREISSLSHRQKSFREGYVPSVTIDHKLGEKLLAYQGENVSISIKQKVQEAEALNIVVDIPGKGTDDNLILVTAHYDSVAHSPGSSDNAGGTVTLLKVAEYFSRHKPGRDLRIIFFSGEELGLLGSQAYAEKHREELKKRAALIVNVDVSGDPVGFDTAFVLGTKELLGYFTGVVREKGIAFQSSLDIYSSDGMPFAVYEIPSVSISRRGGQANFFIHTSRDLPRYVSNRGLKNTINATIFFLQRVLDAGIFPVRREIDDSLREKIQKYLWNLTYEKPQLEWEDKYKR
ncbi:MAG: M20/M25/M40 family metallo-hydrolase [Candidatus Cloacimonetes bacterium]|nr:M20/M25/M40 family metallo-hydrolase [Candidatus Cloacimonadota bacterium]